MNLGRGEGEVITLAFTSTISAVIDDQRAREIAKRMRIMVTSTIGLLLKLEQMELIESASEKVVELKNRGFYVLDALLKEVKAREKKKK